jgi:hypothetical protein
MATERSLPEVRGGPRAPFMQLPIAQRATLLGDLFVAGNLAFLSLDVYLAHEANAFAHAAERIPVAFGVISALLLALPLLRRSLGDRLGLTIGWLVALCSIAVGVSGMVLHLRDTFFAEQSLHNLVYTAPFAAPLSYVGLGLLVLLDRVDRGRTWAQWVLLLALFGFLGTFVLAVADHAQNGFFHATEWLPVGASAFAVGFLLMAAVRPSLALVKASAAMMACAALIGALGCVLHVLANTRRPGATLWEEFLYGAPLFAPLLMCDLAVLAGLGLWILGVEEPLAPASSAHAGP